VNCRKHLRQWLLNTWYSYQNLLQKKNGNKELKYGKTNHTFELIDNDSISIMCFLFDSLLLLLLILVELQARD